MSHESERRSHTRVRCKISCQVVAGHETVVGTVCDVSAGGLLVNAAIEMDQGDAVRVCLEAGRGRPEIEVEAIVWHVRSVRSRRSGAISCAMGLVLSDAPESWAMLIDRMIPTRHASVDVVRDPEEPKPEVRTHRPKSPGRPRASARAPAATKPPVAAKPLLLDPPTRYRVRVKQQGKPHTRSIQVFADSLENAREIALAETGEGWVVLEVEIV